MIVNNTKQIQYYLQKINQILKNTPYKRIVLQIHKKMLSISFQMSSLLKKIYTQSQFYVLYDSLKQQCCTDILGASHLNYDCLIHFGPACFSQPVHAHHFYIFQRPNVDRIEQIKAYFFQNTNQLKQKNIKYLIISQSLYKQIKNIYQTNPKLQQLAQLLHLPFDKKQKQQYLMFGYYGVLNHQQLSNILILQNQIDLQQNQKQSLIQQFLLSKNTIPLKIQSIYTVQNNQLQLVKINNSKKLMQRYSLASQINNHNIFGLLISNTSTNFFKKTASQCQKILKKHNKKVFCFMMNNLNQVKLGNFPQIQVYVIISCFNHCLFSLKDFCKLVVTPIDLQIAFQGRAFDSYAFDQNSNYQRTITQEKQIIYQQTQSEVLVKIDKKQLALQKSIQTLDLYRQKQYKGLQFKQKKQIKKMTKGKIGIAQEYHDL